MQNTLQTYALGILSTVVALLMLSRIPFARMRDWMQGLARRTLGIVESEPTEGYDSMAAYYRELENDTIRRIQVQSADIHTLRNEMHARSDTLSTHGTRVNRTKREVEELGILLRAYTEVMGPIWRTAEGHSAPMVMLSTSHLRNIVNKGFGGYEARQFAEVELARRGIDSEWRAREARGEQAPTAQQMAAQRSEEMGRARRAIAPREAAGRVLTLTPGAQARVNNFSPNWARALVTELRTKGTKRLHRETQSRVDRVLPVWTREIIKDLLRRNNS